jgi:hypothetical protein
MTEPSLWEACWRQLENTFSSTATRLKACNPRLWSQFGYRMTDSRPMEAWAEFKRVESPAGIEDIVVFFAVERVDEMLTATIDISTGEGLVLADGPTLAVPFDAYGGWHDQLLTYLTDADQFLRNSQGLLREALC